jgi:hypothetical protein
MKKLALNAFTIKPQLLPAVLATYITTHSKYSILGPYGTVVVKPLRYKLGGRGLETR